MEKFANGEFNVLVCTTIIESGIDIPNANTLIVDRADMLGLAQMYQLRGRVGRSTNQSYAYLFHPKNRVLTESAQARLATIFEASELGAGFQVALRDLEIRGAGNLLGAEQSGHIASVGFDLYTEMLAEAVEDLKSNAEARPREVLPHEERDLLRKVLIDLPVAAHVPESYVPEIEARLALYQRISGLRTLEDAAELERETVDRLGELPVPLVNLLRLVRIRIAARDGSPPRGRRHRDRDAGQPAVQRAPDAGAPGSSQGWPHPGARSSERTWPSVDRAGGNAGAPARRCPRGGRRPALAPNGDPGDAGFSPLARPQGQATHACSPSPRSAGANSSLGL